jgi:hypothetical protein
MPSGRHTVSCLKSFQGLDWRQMDISGDLQRCFADSAPQCLGLGDAPVLSEQVELADGLNP